MLGIFALAIHIHVAVVVDDEGGEHGEVEEPFLAEHPVVAIAAADADESDVDIDLGGIGRALLEFVGGLDATALIADACEP